MVLTDRPDFGPGCGALIPAVARKPVILQKEVPKVQRAFAEKPLFLPHHHHRAVGAAVLDIEGAQAGAEQDRKSVV